MNLKRAIFDLLYEHREAYKKSSELVAFLRILGTEVGYITGHPYIPHTDPNRSSLPGCATCQKIASIHRYVPNAIPRQDPRP